MPWLLRGGYEVRVLIRGHPFAHERAIVWMAGLVLATLEREAGSGGMADSGWMRTLVREKFGRW